MSAGVFFRDRDPETVKRWAVIWHDAGIYTQEYALAGRFDFVADLASALRLLEPEEVAGVWLMPCVKQTPVQVYKRIAKTLRMMHGRDSGTYARWDNALATVGYTLPLWLELNAENELAKTRFKSDEKTED